MQTLKSSLVGQYGAGLAMLRQATEICPAELWTAGLHPRNFWRIAYHALFFTHLYLMPDDSAFEQWSEHRDCIDLWGDPERESEFTKEQLLAYLDYVDQHLEEFVDRLDLEARETGFDWYPNMTKLDHQLLNLRHLQGHVGQLSELIMSQDPEAMVKWVGIRRP